MGSEDTLQVPDSALAMIDDSRYQSDLLDCMLFWSLELVFFFIPFRELAKRRMEFCPLFSKELLPNLRVKERAIVRRQPGR